MSPDRLAPILERKRAEIEAIRSSLSDLRGAAADAPPARDWSAALRRPSRVSLIAELKRRAPSAGALRTDMDAAGLAVAYEEAGAAAVSVLTDADFDGGLDDLGRARSVVGLPVLRKDFLLDPIQVWESRAAGADAVLLIVRALPGDRLSAMLEAVRSAGLGSLVEVHDASELERAIEAGAEVIGVNNRDLGTFELSLDVSRELIPRVPGERIAVAESGVESSEDVRALGELGADAVLVGRALVSHPEPGAMARSLVGHRRRGRA